MNRIVIGLFVFLAVGFWFQHRIWAEKLSSTAQSILDENTPGNMLAISHFEPPSLLAAFTGFGGGSFTLKRKDGSALTGTCGAVTVDYTWRQVGKAFSIEIKPDQVFRIAACQ